MAKQVNMAEGESRESIRGQYERFGVQAFYERAGSSYRNPHEPSIREALRQSVDRWQPDFRNVLALACGSGEVTLALLEADSAHGAHSTGIDPYTGAAYFERTGQQAEAIMFEQISTGILADRRYSLIVCSFALHLVEKSRLPLVAYQLSLIAPALLILTPHKRPVLRPEWGWQMAGELSANRIRARFYQSTSVVGG